MKGYKVMLGDPLEGREIGTGYFRTAAEAVLQGYCFVERVTAHYDIDITWVKNKPLAYGNKFATAAGIFSGGVFYVTVEQCDVQNSDEMAQLEFDERVTQADRELASTIGDWIENAILLRRRIVS